MPGLVLPTVRAAAVQAAPVFLDLAATLDKVDALVDIVGTYQRPDIFQLLVDTRRPTPLRADPGGRP